MVGIHSNPQSCFFFVFTFEVAKNPHVLFLGAFFTQPWTGLKVADLLEPDMPRSLDNGMFTIYQLVISQPSTVPIIIWINEIHPHLLTLQYNMDVMGKTVK